MFIGEHDHTDAKVRCNKCGLESGLFDDTDTATAAEQAVRAWNERVLAPAAADFVGRAANMPALDASSLKQFSTIPGTGRWQDPADERMHTEMMRIVHGLRPLLPPAEEQPTG